VFVLDDSYSSYKVNSLSAGWIGPHTTYPYYFLLYAGVIELLCAFSFLVEIRHCEAQTIEWYVVALVVDATFAKCVRCGEDEPSSCYFTQYPNTSFMTTMRVSYRFPFFL
jgi:hypothetical protein